MNPFDYSFSYNKRIISKDTNAPINQLTEIIFQELNPYSRLEHIRKLALNNLLCNLIIASHNGRYLSISKNLNYYTNYNRLGLSYYSYRFIIGWLQLLLNEGYINQIPGYYDVETGTGKLTRLYIEERLISLLHQVLNNSQEFELVNFNPPVILKDKNKNLLTYPTSGRIRDLIKFLNEYNEFISSVQIKLALDDDFFRKPNFCLYPLVNTNSINIYHTIQTTRSMHNGGGIPLLITLEPNQLEYKNLQGQLYRVYNNGKFTEGGRFYGAAYQQLSEKDRNKILINGSPVVEVDYSSFHLNILYHKTNKQFDGDPYSKVISIPELRPLLKVVSLIAVNSANPTQAYKAVKQEIRNNIEFQRLKRIYRMDEKELLKKFESTHFRISNYFYSGIGIKLQHLDSQIAETVLKHFTRNEIPCLCVHDSFLVPIEHGAELKEVMNKVYKKYLGFDAQIKESL